MILLTHILIAVAGIIYTSYLFFFPSQKGVRFSQALVALTALSGIALIVMKPQNWAQVCTMGLLYVGAVSVGIYATQRKLANQEDSL